MKAITLLQPWATLVAIGAKRFETRSWRTEYRGPLAIHASASFPRVNQRLCWTPAFRVALRSVPNGLPTGCVLATCEVRQCFRTADLIDQGEFRFERDTNDLLEQLHFGDFTAGRFAWLLSEVRRLPAPIPAKGRLGLWEWDGGPSHLCHPTATTPLDQPMK